MYYSRNIAMKQLSRSTAFMISNISKSWYKAFEEEFSKPYFDKVLVVIEKERRKIFYFISNS